jgi:hypothetical protein
MGNDSRIFHLVVPIGETPFTETVTVIYGCIKAWETVALYGILRHRYSFIISAQFNSCPRIQTRVRLRWGFRIVKNPPDQSEAGLPCLPTFFLRVPLGYTNPEKRSRALTSLTKKHNTNSVHISEMLQLEK